MGWIDRVERGLERTVNGVFAKAFKSAVQPVEISAAIRRAMDDRATLLAPGRTIVPNLYAIELSPSDYGRLAEYEQALSQELIASAAEHADHNRYAPAGDFQVSFSQGGDLETGVFRVRPGSSGPGSRQGAPEQTVPRDSYRQAQQQGYAAGPPRGGQQGYQGQQQGYQGQQGPVSHAPWAGGGQGQGAQQRPGGFGPGPGAAAGGGAAYGSGAQRRGGGQPPRIHPAARPWLEINGDRYPLINALTTVGRDHDADIVLDDPGISRRHSELRVTNDGPHLVTTIRDLGSTNGTFVNSERVSTEHLNDGDRITIGRITATFRAGRR